MSTDRNVSAVGNLVSILDRNITDNSTIGRNVHISGLGNPNSKSSVSAVNLKVNLEIRSRENSEANFFIKDTTRSLPRLPFMMR